MSDTNPPPFWKRKGLSEMSDEEWESLCDGCGRCCLIKITNTDTGRLHTTSIACHMLNIKSCQCARYETRQKEVLHCIKITPEKAQSLTWLPKTCAYRLVAQGKDLHDWHPLISGSPDTVHEAGISVRGHALSERHIDPVLFDMFIEED